MILDYLGVQVAYDRLLKLLKIEPFGASAYNLRYLSSLGLNTGIDVRDMTSLRELIQLDTPVIALVDTGELPYWSQKTNHVVVVVGFNEEQIFVNDPAFANHPVAVDQVAFELAWLGFDYLSAVITPASE
jgi:ABC-type bacteriocin/lantibiotic exporter with double-glycine peptidase domain